MKVSLCIPAYNEESIIRETARTLDAYMRDNFDDYEILISNDGSTDGTADAVRELALPNVRVVGYEKNRGKGCAVRTAILESTGDVAIFTDCDLAYGTDVIKTMADMFEANPDADMIIGSRNISADGYEGYTFIRKLASKTYIKVLCLFGGFKLSDSQCGMKGFRRETAREIFPLCEVDRWAFDFEILIWATEFGKKILEMPVKIINHRESKINVMSDTVKMLRDVIKMKKRIKKKKAEMKK